MSDYKKGDRVKIRPEWRDEGDEGLVWEVVGEDEGKGRVDITPLGPELDKMNIRPVQTVDIQMIERI